jgi:hypothetical protein
MNQLSYAFGCFILAVIFGGTWGGLVFLFDRAIGALVGLSFFLIGFVLLLRIGSREERTPQHNRRFNDT